MMGHRCSFGWKGVFANAILLSVLFTGVDGAGGIECAGGGGGGIPSCLLILFGPASFVLRVPNSYC